MCYHDWSMEPSSNELKLVGSRPNSNIQMKMKRMVIIIDTGDYYSTGNNMLP